MNSKERWRRKRRKASSLQMIVIRDRLIVMLVTIMVINMKQAIGLQNIKRGMDLTGDHSMEVHQIRRMVEICSIDFYTKLS